MAALLGRGAGFQAIWGRNKESLSRLGSSCLFPKVKESKDAEPTLWEQQQRCGPVSSLTLGNCCRTVCFPLGEVTAPAALR